MLSYGVIPHSPDTTLCARGVACAGPCGGSLRRTVRALSRQPSAAVRVAEALAVLFADFFLEKAVENEDKHSLEGVEYGEEVRHNNRGLADEEEPKRPGETEQTQQSKSTHDPGFYILQSARVWFQGGGVLHHFVHCDHQEDEIEHDDTGDRSYKTPYEMIIHT